MVVITINPNNIAGILKNIIVTFLFHLTHLIIAFSDFLFLFHVLVGVVDGYGWEL